MTGTEETCSRTGQEEEQDGVRESQCGACGACGSEVPELPADALLQVLRWLPRWDLVRGPRGLSRRWREAALSPVLWRGGSLCVDGLADSRCRAILRLAPQLESLTVRVPSGRLSAGADPLEDALASTECAAATLTLVALPGRVQRRVLRRQVELGRLRRLALWVRAEDAADVLGEVLDSPDARLSELSVQLLSYEDRFRPPVKAPPTWQAGRAEASLKRLSYMSASPDPLLEYVLLAHAATLESVHLSQYKAHVGAVGILGQLPRLREAVVSGQREVCDALCAGASPLLRDLTIHFDERGCGFDAMAGWMPYFMDAATSLTRLSFSHGKSRPWYCGNSVLDAVVALGTSGRASLEELHIGCSFHDPTCLGSALPQALRGLPRLHTLIIADLHGPSLALDAITPGAAPSLRLLRLDGISGECREDRCYVGQVYRLLQRHPLLHVVGVSKACHHDTGLFDGDVEFYDCASETERIKKHLDVKDPHCGLYAHPKEECELDLHREKGSSAGGRGIEWVFVGHARHTVRRQEE